MPLALALLVFASGPVAVVGVVPKDADGTADAPSATPLAQALVAAGMPAVAGSALRERLLGRGRPFGHDVLPAIVLGVTGAEFAYDNGDFVEAANLCSLANETLDLEMPSPRREAITRNLQVLWGAALLGAGNPREAAAHFDLALARNPYALLDQDRFAPPVQQLFEEERHRLVNGPKVPLTISGTAGAAVFVDGIARGSPPLTLQLQPHLATVWLEVLGHAGLAHEVQVGQVEGLTIDWQLEAALHEGATTEAWLALPRPEPLRRDLAARVALRTGAKEVVFLQREGAGEIAVLAYARSGAPVSQRRVPAEGLDEDKLALALLEEGELKRLSAFAAQPLAARAVAEPTVIVAPRVSANTKRFPWLVTGVVAGGVVLVGAAVALGLCVHPTNGLLLERPATP